MKKEQKVICAIDFAQFNMNVGNHLEQGWGVVPGTVQIAITSSHYGQHGQHLTLERHFCIVEK